MELLPKKEQEEVDERVRKYREGVSSVENPEEVRDKILENTNKETAEVLDAGEQTTETAKKLGDDDSKGREIIVETQEITDEAVENRNNAVEKIDAEKNEDFMVQFENGEDVYNFLNELDVNQDNVNKIWDSTTEEDRGRMVDMIVDYARKNNLARDKIRELTSIIELTQHIGRIDTYRWLIESDLVGVDAGELGKEIKKGMEEDGQEYKDETAKINKEWEGKDEEEKKEEIEEYKEEIEKDPRVMDVREKMEREKKTMGGCVDELRKETEDIVKNRSLAMTAIQEQLNKGAGFSELSGVDQIDQKEAKTALGEVSRIANNRLTNEKLNYLLQFEDNLGDLLNEHKNRESTIENFEEIVKMIGDFEDCLREFEEMGEIEQQEAREEIKGLLGWLEEVHKKNPELWKYLLGIGMVAGALALASIFGVLVSGLEGEIPFGWREAKIVGAGAAAIASGGHLLFSKRRAGTRNDLKKGAKFLSGGLLGGAFMLAGYLFDEKRRDDFMKKASGVDFPGWYYWLAPKKEDSGN